jgi:hypothetical protein
VRWCSNEREYFPEAEFSEEDGVVYHDPADGGRHPAGRTQGGLPDAEYNEPLDPNGE